MLGKGSVAAMTGSTLGGILGLSASLVIVSLLVTDCDLITYGGCSLGDGYVGLAIMALGTGSGMALGCWIGLRRKHRAIAAGAAALLVVLLVPAGILAGVMAVLLIPIIGSGGTPLDVRLATLLTMLTFWALLLGYLAHRLAVRYRRDAEPPERRP